MTASRGLLAVSRATDPVVGSNQRDAVSGGGWLYALPRLEHPRIVCLGAPPRATIAALARSGRVVIVERRRRRRERAAAEVGSAGLANVTLESGGEPDTILDGSIHLLVIRGSTGAVDAVRYGWLERLASDGIVVVEPADTDAVTVLAREAPWLGPGLRLTIAPFRGEARSIVPADHPWLARALEEMGLGGTVSRRASLATLERRLLGARPMRAIAKRAALVLGPGLSIPPDVPDYVRSVAAADGSPLDGWAWAVAARGDYDSQKVLMVVAPTAASAPTGVVKITRSDAHAGRLRNEAEALRALHRLPMAAGRVPTPWFAGTHAGRVILGESLIEGTTFAARATFDASDPLLGDALGWLTELAGATVEPVPLSDVAAILSSTGGSTFPGVMQHGDPGIWNLVARPGGEVAFLDWEAAERPGMPLWDLLYFFRSYAIAASRHSGVHDRLDAAAAHLLDSSPLADRLVDAVSAYRARISLPAASVEGLVYACWVHRALKEATRLSADRLEHGRFVRLIRRMLADPDAPTLRRLALRDGAPRPAEPAGEG